MLLDRGQLQVFCLWHTGLGIFAARPPVCLLRICDRFQKSLRSRWGLGPCNQSIASSSRPCFRAVLGMAEPSKQSTAADGGSLDGNQSVVATSRC